MVVDCGSNRLNHYQHFDFFSYQTKMTNSLVVKAALQNWDKTGFESLVAFHNLDYYVNLMNRLRDYAMKDNMETFITRIIGNEAADELNEKIPGLFK
jgi:queuine/archaeosine tRNA-ribosyltransferase